jgi:hypothetical protein
MVVIGAGQQLGAIGVSAEQVSSCGEPLHVVGLQRCLTVGDQELVVGHAPGLPLERGPATYDRIRDVIGSRGPPSPLPRGGGSGTIPAFSFPEAAPS